MEKKASRIYLLPRPILKVFAFISIIIMLFNMVLIIVDVFCRYVLNSPISGISETVKMMMAWVAYSGTAFVMMNGDHMQLGTVYDRMKGRINHVFSTFIYLVCTLFSCAAVRASINIFITSFRAMEKAVAANTVYIWIGKFAPIVGWTLLAIEALLMAIYSIKGIIDPARTAIIGHKSELDTVTSSAEKEENE